MSATRLALTLLAAPLLVGSAAAQGDSHAAYRVRFDATWSATSHPGAYPSFAHFSPPIGATHDAGVSFWDAGGHSSPGMESMAETGNVALLFGEMNAALGNGNVGSIFSMNGPNSPGSSSTLFDAVDGHSLVSLVTMVAPSPDWFVGVHDLDLLASGVWADDLVVDLFAYDAGTDSGLDFNSGNADTNPQEPIALITGGPFTGAVALGTYTFTRRASSLEYGCLNPADSLTADSAPLLGSTVVLTAHDPTGSMAVPSAAFLALSASPDPAFPCGLSLPNFGLAAPGADGELLIGQTLFFRSFGFWTGAPVDLNLVIPPDPNLQDVALYGQAILADSSGRVGLTNAIELVLGS